jgi:hypothetical protein
MFYFIKYRVDLIFTAILEHHIIFSILSHGIFNLGNTMHIGGVVTMTSLRVVRTYVSIHMKLLGVKVLPVSDL